MGFSKTLLSDVIINHSEKDINEKDWGRTTSLPLL